MTHRIDGMEHVDAYSVSSGERLWRASQETNFECKFAYSDGPYSTPIIDEGRVFARAANGTLRCFDRVSGEIVWKRELNEDYEVEPTAFPVASSPEVADGKVFVLVGGTTRNGSVVAMDSATGETTWTAGSDRLSHATPVYAIHEGQGVLYVLGNQRLTAFDASDGKIFWDSRFAAKNQEMEKYNSASPLIRGDKVFVCAFGAGARCYQWSVKSEPKIVWEASRRLATNQIAPIIETPSGIITYSANRRLTCLNRLNGRKVFQQAVESGGEPQWVRVGSQLLMLGTDGHLTIFDLRQQPFHIIWKSSQPLAKAPCYACLAVVEDLVLIRGKTELVACRMNFEN
ncbi:MAG: PQQ-binding-like beta-propeller repeat protein [Planctomycetota bacterium]